MTDSTTTSNGGPGSAMDGLEDAEVDRSTFDYMMKKDVPSLVDAVCRHLMLSQPADPSQSIIEYLAARRCSSHGGAVVAGRNVGGGWLRFLSPTGAVTGAVDRLPFWPHGGMQLIATSSRDPLVYVVMNLSDGEGGESSSSTDGNVTEIRAFTFAGKLSFTVPFTKSIGAIEYDSDKDYLWICYRGGGGAVFQHNGSMVRELPSSNTASGIRLRDGHYWLLTPRSIEQREMESGTLKTAIHLPDSMLKCNSFILGHRHVYCAAPNPDGTANYVGVFDFHGRPATHFVPQSGSVLTFDIARGGLWQTARHGSQLTFTNEKGVKAVSVDLNRAKNVNIGIDRGSGLLWYYRQEGEASLLGLYDPVRGSYRAEVEMPEVMGGQTLLVPM